MLLRETEREKYSLMWKAVPDYRNNSPGVDNVARFLSIMNPLPNASIIDIGCGTGEAGKQLAAAGLDVWWLDITDAGLDPDIPRARFIETTIWHDWRWQKSTRLRWEYGFCCDVMEHIPPEYAVMALDRILTACQTVWFQICNDNDSFGPSCIGEPLHLTVRPFQWWRQQFIELGACVFDARDLQGLSLFVVQR